MESVKMKISENKKRGSFSCPKDHSTQIRFLGQKVCPVARSQKDTHIDRQTARGTTEGTCQDVSLQTIIKNCPTKKQTNLQCILVIIIMDKKQSVSHYHNYFILPQIQLQRRSGI